MYVTTLHIEASRLNKKASYKFLNSLQQEHQVRILNFKLFQKNVFFPDEQYNGFTASRQGNALFIELELIKGSNCNVKEMLKRVKEGAAYRELTDAGPAKIFILYGTDDPVDEINLQQEKQSKTAEINFEGGSGLNFENGQKFSKNISEMIPILNNLNSSISENGRNKENKEENEERIENLKKLLAPQKFRFAIRPNKQKTRMSQIFTQGLGEFGDKLKKRHVIENLRFLKRAGKKNILRKEF